jgi:mannose-6-phosphate isomerase-like protein (cupin superfamily)
MAMADLTEAEARRDTAPREPRSPAKVMKYVKPKVSDYSGKAVIRLVQSDICFGNVQVLSEGGDTNLHSHAGMDGFWFVLSGRARFYGPTRDEVIAELGPHEGVFIPRNFRYWFEKVGEGDLEILQVSAIDRSVRNDRTNYGELTTASREAAIYDMEGNLLSRGHFVAEGSPKS